MAVLLPGARQVITIGGLVLPLPGLKILRATLTSGAFSGFIDNSFGIAPVAYTPSGALAFYLRAARLVQSTAVGANNSNVGLHYSDSAVGMNAGAIGANPTGILSGTAGTTAGVSDWPFTANSLLPQEMVCGGKVPNGKYPTAQFSAAVGTVWLYGYEAA